MIRFPFFGYSYPFNYYHYHTSCHSNTQIPEQSPTSNHIIVNNTDSQKKQSKSNLINFYFEGLSDPNKVVLEILGIQLYLDDLIILGLLFILYQENVKDEMLFICLILLLLS